MVKLTPLDMGEILEPLEKQFKKLTSGQKDVWYEKLCNLSRKHLELAVDHLTEKNRTFPTIQEVKSAYWEARHNDPDYREASTAVEGCAHCKYGWVVFTLTGNTEHTLNNIYEFAHPCAYCHKEHNIPMVIKRDGSIFWASRRIRDGKYVQDMNGLEEISGAVPGKRSERPS